MVNGYQLKLIIYFVLEDRFLY